MKTASFWPFQGDAVTAEQSMWFLFCSSKNRKHAGAAMLEHPNSHHSCSQLLCLMMALFLFSSVIAAETLRVKSGESIAAAIAKATDGDTIEVAKGFYPEHLKIDKSITLKGINRPTISGNQQDDVIRITAKNVTVQGFIIRDSGANLTAQNAGIYIDKGADQVKITECDIAYSLFGLWIEGVSDVEISHNLITGKRDVQSAQRGNGIQLYNTTGARILNNHISFTRDGIYVDVSHHAVFSGNKIHNTRYGTHYMNSYYNVWENNEVFHNRGGLALMETRNQIIRNNKAWGNTDHGIMLRTIQDSTIENNVVAGNQRGFFIYDAEYNTLKNNLIINNIVGIHLWAGSINNQINGNSFINNQEQIRYVASKDVAWLGNYWSNYAGWDRNGDGVGDVPYFANDIVDRLMWQTPSVKLLLNSPAVQTLRLISQQFPVVRAPSVVDEKPRMRPLHSDKQIGSAYD